MFQCQSRDKEIGMDNLSSSSITYIIINYLFTYLLYSHSVIHKSLKTIVLLHFEQLNGHVKIRILCWFLE